MISFIPSELLQVGYEDAGPQEKFASARSKEISFTGSPHPSSSSYAGWIMQVSGLGSGSPPPPPQLLTGGQMVFEGHVVSGQLSVHVQSSHQASNSSRCSSSVIENSSSSPSWLNSFSLITTSVEDIEHSKCWADECGFKVSALRGSSYKAAPAAEILFSFRKFAKHSSIFKRTPSCPQDSARTNQT